MSDQSLASKNQRGDSGGWLIRRLLRSGLLGAEILLSAFVLCGCWSEQGGGSSEPPRAEEGTSRQTLDLGERLAQARVVEGRGEIRFDEEDRGALLGGSWSIVESTPDGESTWVWAMGREATVELLLLGEAERARRLTFRAWPFVWSGSPGQYADIRINGEPMGRVRLETGQADYEIPVPAGVLVHGANFIVFQFAYARSPAEVLGTSDSRRLSVAFNHLALELQGAPAARRDLPASLGWPMKVEGGFSQALGTRVIYRVTLPGAPALEFDLSSSMRSPAAESVWAEVVVRRLGEDDVSVFREQMSGPEMDSERRYRVDLARWSGERVDLQLSIWDSGPRREVEGRRQADSVIWGSPTVVGKKITREPSCVGCNVVLVTMDTLRADRLGAYGYSRATSPNIDAFSASGVVFEKNVSQSGTTLSSIPSIHTSKFPSTDRILGPASSDEMLGRKVVLREGETTIATVLREMAYQTVAVIAHTYARCEWGACQGFEVRDDEYVAPESSVDTMARVGRALDTAVDEPFFLWIHFRQPHSPYNPSLESFRAVYDAGQELTFYSPELWSGGVVRPEGSLLGSSGVLERLNEHYADEAGEPRSMFQTEAGELALTPTVVRQIGAQYDGGLREVDAQFGVLLKQLEDRGVGDRTVVVLASDHGENLGERGFIGHNRLDHPVLHTPLIIRSPGRRPSSVTVATMNVDILPTILAEVGVEGPEEIRGRDLFGDDLRERFQYAEYPSAQMVMRGDEKLIVGQAKHEGVHLFNLSTDPGELENLAPDQPERVARLMALIDDIQATPVGGDSTLADPDLIQMLKELGYIR